MDPASPTAIPGGLNTLTIIVLLLTLWHASHVLGARPALAFFAITVVTSWLFEELGVSSGLIFGSYHYTSALGPMVGAVPVLIPAAWFVLAYPSYFAADLMLDRVPIRIPGSLGDLLGLALFGALVMTATDVMADPILSGPSLHAWVWDSAGRSAGVPAQNYVGWIVTAFVIHLAVRSLERRTASRSGRPGTSLALG
jgi:putative membrane protein